MRKMRLFLLYAGFVRFCSYMAIFQIAVFKGPPLKLSISLAGYDEGF